MNRSWLIVKVAPPLLLLRLSKPSVLARRLLLLLLLLPPKGAFSSLDAALSFFRFLLALDLSLSPVFDFFERDFFGGGCESG